MEKHDNEWLAVGGKALFGEERWLASLCLLLQIGDRNMRRWLAGDSMPPPVEEELRKALVNHLETRQLLIQNALFAVRPEK